MSPMQINFPSSPTDAQVSSAYELAKERYAQFGVNTDEVLKTLASVPISVHCWQGDDVAGFEHREGGLSGGIAVTGNYLGRARTIDELRADLEKVYSLLPGKHRLNLHASYGDFGGKKVDRNEMGTEHFASWAEWGKEHTAGIDFNPTCFAHAKAADGFTLSHADKGIRDFWIEHCITSREIGAFLGEKLGTPAITNIWIPDGMKDLPVNRRVFRDRLQDSLDKVIAKPLNKKHNLDAVESKLFGIGAESYTVGSHEFYLGYAVKNDLVLCLDAGHYHPTEGIADKLSAVMCQLDHALLHVSRGVRWDSDHVTILSDELKAVAEEIVRGDYLKRVHIGLDFFDASINRIAAWTIGTRSMIKGLMLAMLDPVLMLQEAEEKGDYSTRLAVLEEMKTMPSGAIWDYYCAQQGVVTGAGYLEEIKQYEQSVLVNR